MGYDRAWWFARFVADTYGVDALRTLYVAAAGPHHADFAHRGAARARHGPHRAACALGAVAEQIACGAMTRVLLVTNDFPPRPGGIQSYLEQFVGSPRRHRRAPADRVRAALEGLRGLRPRRGLPHRAPSRHADAARARSGAPNAGAHRRGRHRDRVVRGRRAAGPASRPRPPRRRPAGAGQHARPRGGLVDASGRAFGAAAHRRHHRRRDLRQRLHPRQVRLRVRAPSPPGASAAGSRRRPLPPRRRGARRTARPLSGSAIARPSSAYRGWSRARARTCSSRRCPTSGAASTAPRW